MRKKAILLLLCISLIAIGTCTAFVTGERAYADDSVETLTLTQTGNPVIAGIGGSSFDEGVLYYETSGNTVGFSYDMSNSVLEADYVFTEFAFPSWFSITFKASNVDRTQSPNLEQKGYSFILFPAGNCEVWKDGQTVAQGVAAPFSTATVYRIKAGAYNSGNEVNLILTINGEQIINATDSNSPYLTGSWMNYCADGDVAAQVSSTLPPAYKDYNTYSTDDFRYPTAVAAAGSQTPVFGHGGTFETFDSSSTVGYNLHMKNYSFEAAFTLKEGSGSGWIGIATRVSGFGRVLQTDLQNQGYSFLFFTQGLLQIFKNGTGLIASASIPALLPGETHVLEVGSIDINDSTTKLVAWVDKKCYIDYNDSNNPLQSAGYMNINADGNIAMTVEPVHTKLSVTGISESESENATQIHVNFVNNFSFTPMKTQDFTADNLNAITLNNVSIYQMNLLYTAEDGKNAVDVAYERGRLTLSVCKRIKDKKTGAVTDFTVKTLRIFKTKNPGGFSPPTGLILKQSIYKEF